MATTSNYFTVSDISFPTTCFLVNGEKPKITFTVKATTDSFTGVVIYLAHPSYATVFSTLKTETFTTPLTKGKAVTFTDIPLTFISTTKGGKKLLEEEYRSIDTGWYLQINGREGSGVSNLYDRIDLEEFHLIKKHYNPSIVLRADRASLVDSEWVTSDEGTYILPTIGLHLPDKGETDPYTSFTANIAVKEHGKTTRLIYKSLTIDDFLDEDVKKDGNFLAIDNGYSKAKGYDITVNFGDEYEAVSTTIETPRAFANVHLSGAMSNGKQIGGVAFGMFSTVENGDATGKFECMFPAYFHNGVYDGDGNSVGLTIQVGTEMAVGALIKDGAKQTIYRYTVDGLTAGTNAKTVTLPSTVSRLINMYGSFLRNGEIVYPVNSYHTSSYYCFARLLDANTLQYRASTDMTDGIIVLEYTKEE